MTAPAIKGTPPRTRICAECYAEFWPRRDDMIFCGGACRREHHHRNQERGLRLLKLALEWRRKREKGGLAFLTQEVDAMLAEDRKRRDDGLAQLTPERRRQYLGEKPR